jgi:Ca-activated chloride channel family protein
VKNVPLVAALVAAGALAGASAQAQLPTFRGGVDLVSFGVTVIDRRGGYIADLTAEDFEVIEEGQKQAVSSFARGDQQESAPELHLGLLFDTSGSMDQDISLARSAAVKFLNTFPDAEDMTLVDFDTEVRVARYGQRDFPRLVERIRTRKPDGWTAMYDAMGVYLDGAAEDEGRTILVLYTDGGDTRSTIGFGDLMTLIRASDVTVYSIGFLNNQSSGARAEQRARLYQIAEATGGQAFFPTTMKDVEAAYEKIVAQIRAQYTLGYTSTNTRQDGQWRKVDIRLKRPDLRGARVQARKGYFAPYKP